MFSKAKKYIAVPVIAGMILSSFPAYCQAKSRKEKQKERMAELSEAIEEAEATSSPELGDDDQYKKDLIKEYEFKNVEDIEKLGKEIAIKKEKSKKADTYLNGVGIVGAANMALMLLDMLAEKENNSPQSLYFINLTSLFSFGVGKIITRNFRDSYDKDLKYLKEIRQKCINEKITPSEIYK